MDDTSKQQTPTEAPANQEKAAQNPLAARRPGPMEEMERMMDRFQELMPHGWHWGLPRWPERWSGIGLTRTPVVDIIDRDAEVVIRAELPGMNKDDLEISLGDVSVTLKGRRRQETEEEKGDFFRREISRESFTRTLSLPAEVDAAQARASFRDGVLEVVVAKKQPVERKKIPID